MSNRKLCTGELMFYGVSQLCLYPLHLKALTLQLLWNSNIVTVYIRYHIAVATKVLTPTEFWRFYPRQQKTLEHGTADNLWWKSN